MQYKINESHYYASLNQALLTKEVGSITKSRGLFFEAHLPGASIGSIYRVLSISMSNSLSNIQGEQESDVFAEVIGFSGNDAFLMPFEECSGIHKNSLVTLYQKKSSIPVGKFLLGRVMNAQGCPLDGKGILNPHQLDFEERSLYHVPTHPLAREMIVNPLDLGVRALNGLLTIGKGQRVGIMAGSGVGKSVLLGMLARYTAADVNVIALIGERSREVREFIEKDLGEEGLKKSIMIVSTSDQSPLLRMRGAFLATSIAEYFRDQGKDVLLLMDSVTRFCMAQREIGLSLGEPPASKGYTPSVFASLPKLLERAGMAPNKGSITGIYTVLVEGDDLEDPVADASRAILDGHIVLSRKIAQKNHFPAIDVLQSTSRVMRAIISPEHDLWANQIKDWMAAYAHVEDLIQIGAYVRGSHIKTDQAIAVHEKINHFLRQSVEKCTRFEETLAGLSAIYKEGEDFLVERQKIAQG